MKRQSNYAVPMVWLEVIVSIAACAGTANADFTFGTPTNLGPMVNSSFNDQLPSISADGLELYFMSIRPGGVGDWDIWVARRETTHDPWEEPANLGPVVNSSGEDWAPCISADGLELYFEANRPGGHGGTDILVTVRTATDEPWGEPVNLGPVVNSSSRDGGPSISSDGLELYFKSTRPGGYGGEDLWLSQRPAKGEPWSSPVNLGSTVNGPAWDRGPSISADGLLLFLGSPRAGGYGGEDLWLTSRATKDAAWGEPINLGPSINTAYHEDGPSISADGRTLYFSDYHNGPRPDGNGGSDLWQVSIQPVVDFNGDGRVEGEEVLTLADCWGTDDSICDIGSMPWGDGVVDLEDLRVLAEYMGQEVIDPTLTAHWALDEAEGDIAYDSAGDNDGVVIGTCAWQPAGGQVNGALAFDGTTSILVDRVLNPSDGPFSVLAWIKGAVPSQVLVSQTGGANWLMADASEGTLATDLIPPSGRTTVPPLVSDTVITDDDWHRIGFVWDGTMRTLYVDGDLVAEDVQDGLAGCSGELTIGCDKDRTPGTFWEGLIDDVRIYNRAVRP